MLVGDVFGSAQPLPKLVGCWERLDLDLLTGRVVELNDVLTVRCIGELQVEDLSVVLSLLETISGLLLERLGFDDSDGEVTGVPEDVVGSLLLAPVSLAPGHNDSPIGEASLLGERMGLVVPACVVELGENVLPTGVSFGQAFGFDLFPHSHSRQVCWGRRGTATGDLWNLLESR